MTPLSSSLKPVSLADVLAAVSATGLPRRRKQDLTSAVRTAAHVLGSDPSKLPASPRLLADRLTDVAPMAHGISPARWQNIRSLVRAALALMGPIAPGRHLGGLRPGWETLYLQLPDRPLRSGLSRLFHHCSATGIEPSRFDRAAFDGFVQSLDDSLLKDPAGTVKATQRAWAKAGSLISGWPAVDIGRPTSGASRTYALPWTDFPASLVADVRNWLSHLGTSDFLDGGDFTPVRPRTLQTREAELRRFVSALVLSGQEITTLRSLADVVDPKVVKIGLQFHLARRPIERGGEAPSDIASTAGVILAIARYWVKSPPEHIAEISRMVRRLRVHPGSCGYLT